MEAVSYLHPDWAKTIYNAPSNASMTYGNSIQEPILGAFTPYGDPLPFQEIIFTKDITLTSGLTNSVSVGTVSETSTSAYTPIEGIDDVTAYYSNDKTKIVVYSPSVIFAPNNCDNLFSVMFDSSNYRHAFDNLNNLVLSNFDTSKVTDMSAMFSSCSKLTSLDVSNFNTSNVTTMYGMFDSCSSLTSLDISNFDTSKVTSIQQMFSSCSKLISLDLGNFNLASCTSFDYMLSSCSRLTSITLPYNLQSGYTISLPASTYYKGSAGPYKTIGTATSGTTVACSTADTKVTLTKRS